MEFDEERGHEIAKCPKCGGIADCVALTFLNDPVLTKLGGLVGTIAGNIMGKAIGEITRFRCRSCGQESVRRSYIGPGKGWEYWD